MIIRIASTRAPKVEGVKRAFKKAAEKFHFSFSEIQFATVNASSGVSATPNSLHELMLGAKQRAESVFEHCTLSIGVEGGLFQEHGKVFLQSWTCVYDGAEFHYGCSGAVEIPQQLAAEVLKNGIELGVVIDSIAEKQDVRSNEGTFGILTNDLITREDSFELATLTALMPYFNKKLYTRDVRCL